MSSAFDETMGAMLEWYRQKYEGGDGAALLKAIEHCGMYRLVMPDWVVANFVAAFSSWDRLECATLDDAFRVARPKGFRIDVAREEMNNAAAVYMAILDAEKRGLPIHQDGAIAEVCEKFGINRDKAWKWYNLVRKTPIGMGFDKLRPKVRKKPKKR